jgi:HEAT repeat protein
MTKIRTLFLIFALAGTLVPRALLAEPSKPSVESAKEAARLAYEGHRAIERQEWLAAAGHFRSLERLQKKNNEPADASLYWQAYALSQAHREGEVRETVARLLKHYPQSTWAEDARALVRETEPAKMVSEATREEDALMALDALLASSSERAVPILKKVLAGDHSEKVKTRALFVLTQIDSEAGGEALSAILAGSSPKRLKAEAIRMVAAGADRKTLDRLLPMFQDNDDTIKNAIIDAWITGSRGDLLRQVAERERDAETRRRAIDAMGAVQDSAGLLALFNTVKDPKVQLQVLNGLGIAGAEKELASIARGSSSVEVRAQAIKSLGIAGKDASETIASFYDSADPRIRRAVIEGLITSGGGKSLVKLYRRETDRALKRELLNAIAAVSDEDTLDVIEESLDR